MPVYIDPLHPWIKNRASCHLATDSDDLTELHNLAARIGLKPEWFQPHPLHPHYDIFGKRFRLAAITAGAIPVSAQELVKRCSKYFQQKDNLSE